MGGSSQAQDSVNKNKGSPLPFLCFAAQTSEVPIEHQPNLSPRPSPTTTIPDSIPYLGDQAKEIQDLKAQITKLKKQAKPVIKHHKAWLKSVSLKQRFPRKSFSKKHRVHKESISKQGRKFAKENAQNEGRTREMVDEDKEIDENILSTEDVLSTDKDGVSTDMEKVSTDRPIVSTDGSKVSTDRQNEGTEEKNEGTEEKNEGTEENFEGTEEHIEGTEEQVESTDGHKKGTEEEIATQATQTPTSKIFGDDETIAKVLLNMSQAKAVSREKEKGVELKDVEETDRPRPTSTRSLLTLKPLPKIDPKDKGKKKIEEEDESESESDGIPEAEKKFKQLESDEEMGGIEADRLLAEKLQEQEREQFTIEERAKFLHDTIAAQRKFLAQQRSRSQSLGGGGKGGGSGIDQKMNEKGVDFSKSEVLKEESKEEVQKESKEEESTRKRKLGTRKKMKSRKRRYIQNTSEDDSDKRKMRLILQSNNSHNEERKWIMIYLTENILQRIGRRSETPKVSIAKLWTDFFEVKTRTNSEEVQELLSKLVQNVKIISDELSEYINTPAWNRPLVYCDDDDDEDYTIAITPESPTKEPDIPKENFIIFSNPLFDLDEEIASTKVDRINDEVLESIHSILPGIDSFDAESDLVESVLNRDILIDSSPKIDSLSNEFAGELILPKSIPPEIEEVEFDPEGDILFLESLLYDNSSPRPPEALQANSNAIESLPPSHIPLFFFFCCNSYGYDSMDGD
ncbi:hypothetical protein Tco_1539197 [Tanacetum coccineum]